MTHDYLRQILDYNPETREFIWKVFKGSRALAGMRAGTLCPDGRRRLQIDRKRYLEYRLAIFYMTGKWPKNEIDHINNDAHDEQSKNLREATTSQNQANKGKQKNNTSGYKGVFLDKRRHKWYAQIMVDKKSFFLGYFFTKEEAYSAYCYAAKKYFGEFAHF
jgi:hypothetical protein